MHCLRPAAVRLFSSRSTSFVIKPRSIASITSFPLRLNSQLPRFALQRRWNSDQVTRGVPGSETIATVDESEARVVDFVETTEKETAKDREQVADEAEAAATDYNAAARDDAAYRPKPSQRPADPKETIYVGNLFYDVTADDLKQQLQKYGTVQSATIIHDNRGLSKGFGYVAFDSVDSAMRAIEGMHMQIFGGRRVVAQFAQANYVPRQQSRGTSTPTNTLYVGNISYDMTDKDLQDLFRDIRNVIDVRVSIDRKTGQPKGFAHAEFTDVASAEAAFEILRSKAPFGRRLRVDFSLTNRQSRQREEREDVSPEQLE